MNIDQDEPPALVDTRIGDAACANGVAPDPATTQMVEMSLTKVPLTIVTGIIADTTTLEIVVIDVWGQAILAPERRRL